MILTVANLKGGTSKTTSAAYLAHALAERGHRVLMIDADPQGTLTRWADMGSWSIPVRGMASPRLHVPGVGVDREARDCDAVVIDTPPAREQQHIVESAVRAATHVLVPLAPTAHEYERMATVREMIDDVAHLGRHAAAPVAAALLTRTIPLAHSTAAYAGALRRAGWHVIRSTVARREHLAQSFGAPIERAAATAYGDAVDELLAVRALPATLPAVAG